MFTFILPFLKWCTTFLLGTRYQRIYLIAAFNTSYFFIEIEIFSNKKVLVGVQKLEKSEIILSIFGHFNLRRPWAQKITKNSFKNE